MAVFRVEKNSGYTVMSNHHLRNRALSLKAKGLLSQMLSLPEDWDYTLQGLARINRESIDAIRQAIRELEQAGYIQRSRERDEKGRLRGADYVIFELPQPVPASVSPTLENPTLENPTQENPTLENPMQPQDEQGWQGMDGAAFPCGLPHDPHHAGKALPQPGLGRVADGFPAQMDGHSLWAEEPADIPRLTEDVPNRSKRMKTLGNAVSPPQVFPILKYIADIETGRCPMGGEEL